jgi:putative addiction module component (TIGR02574 family)
LIENEVIMSIIAIRQKLHNYLEVANDKKIKAIYAIMENDVEESALEYTDEVKKELDNRHSAYKNGKAKTVSAEESRKRVQKLIKSAHRK